MDNTGASGDAREAKGPLVGPFVGAIDEGTTSARFMIFRAGTDEIICYHQIEVPSIFVQEGWCEQDPWVIANTVNECIEGACQKLLQLGGKIEVRLPYTHHYHPLRSELAIVFKI